jgi:hypothetical protein
MNASELLALESQLAELNAKIAAAKGENTKAAKIKRALASCKVTHKTMFSHMLVSKTQYCNGIGTAYMIGTLHECRIYQMKHGLRATTEIVDF